jgi:hemerythrin superfamily protein
MNTMSTAAGVVGRAMAAVVSTATGSGPRDAIRLLKDDHRLVETLLTQGEAMGSRASKAKETLFAQIKNELALHERIEEKVFYPALKAHPKGRDIVLEGYQEHHVVDVLLKELTRLPVSDERWAAKFKVLKENIEHHVEEEEGEMFGAARKVFSRAELQALGARMEQMKAGARPAAGRTRSAKGRKRAAA